MAATAVPTPVAAASSGVHYVRREVRKSLPRWQLIRDCLGGEDVVKAAAEKYLPRPNPEDMSDENLKRYDSYLRRAVFYNATRRTLDGLTGQVFVRDPIFDLKNDRLSVFQTDVDGSGVGIIEQSKSVMADTMSFGRVGLLADYPPTEGVATLAQLEANEVRPVILEYPPERIVNWRTVVVGGRKLLSLVVLAEEYTQEDDGFAPVIGVQWRELRLVNGAYTVRIWRDTPKPEGSIPTAIQSQSMQYVVRTYTPKDATGKPFREIPFVFVGALKNTDAIGPVPLHDLATLNIHHYMNSADYEEACYLVGQPTPWASGLTEQWVQNVWKGKLMLGSRGVVSMPAGGQAGLLQVQPNTMPKEAMEAKERQMVALGARLIEHRDVQRTLGEAQIEESGEASILTSAAKNVSAAYNRVLNFAAQFAGGQPGSTFTLNTDFMAAALSYQERAQLVAEWQSGGISYTEYRAAMRKAGVATQSDDVAKSEAKKDKLRLSAMGSALAKAGNSVSGGANNGRTSPSQDGKTQQNAK